MTSSSENLQPKPELKWLPDYVRQEYIYTDLTYGFCLKLFAQLEAAKREKFPEMTMRIWFVEFIKLGWTKEIVQQKYDLIIRLKIYGVEKLDIADWINVKEEVVENRDAYKPYEVPKNLSGTGKEKTLKILQKINAELDKKKVNEGKRYMPIGWKEEVYKKWGMIDKIKRQHRRNMLK